MKKYLDILPLIIALVALPIAISIMPGEFVLRLSDNNTVALSDVCLVTASTVIGCVGILIAIWMGYKENKEAA